MYEEKFKFPISKHHKRRPPLTAEDERNFLSLAKKGDRAAFNILVETWLGLVIRISRAYAKTSVDWEDLFQEGVIGLMEGIKGHDLKRGIRLSTWAIWEIYGCVAEARPKIRNIIYLPSYIQEKIRKLLRHIRYCAQELGREPTVGEIAERLDVPIHYVRKLFLIAIMNDIAALDDVIEQPFLRVDEQADPTECLGPSVMDETALIGDSGSQEEYIVGAELSFTIREALATLTPREEKVIRMRFGLSYTMREFTYEEVARYFRCTRERVRQIQAKALRLMRHPSRSKKLMECIDGKPQDEMTLSPSLVRRHLDLNFRYAKYRARMRCEAELKHWKDRLAPFRNNRFHFEMMGEE